MTPLLTQSKLDALAKVAATEATRKGYYTPCDVGHTLQRERIGTLAARCCEQCDGDLIEIGCYLGGTTTVLVEVARRYNRKVICLDNFMGGDEFKLDEIGLQFKAKLPEWWDVVEFHEIDAHTDQARGLIQSRRYAFAFNDNGHSTEAHVHELETLLPVVDGLIACDDVYFPGVREAIRGTLDKFPGWVWLQAADLAEDWLVKS